jgi:hypothetical protein
MFIVAKYGTKLHFQGSRMIVAKGPGEPPALPALALLLDHVFQFMSLALPT